MPGYWSPYRNGTNCLSNLCSLNNGGCGTNNICTQDHVTGNVTCSCKPGYFSQTGKPSFACTKDPCVGNGTLCGDNSTCVPGLSFFFSCICNQGYESDFLLAYGNCSLYTSQCSGATYCAQSSNLPDSFTCANGIKNRDYTLIYLCKPINVCRSNNGGCAHNCVFTGPSTKDCSCNTGYTLLADDVTCSLTSSSSSSSVGIGVGIGVSLLLILVLLIFILYKRNRRTKPMVSESQELRLLG